MVLEEQLFQLLFEIGASAIVDGYFRESVSTFASALERFHEYFLRMSAHHRKEADELFGASWKLVKRQSERQLGAYIFVWSIYFSDTARTLTSDQAGFRNSVVHQGHIPTEDEARKFGEAVYKIISEALLDLVDSPLKDSVRGVMRSDVKAKLAASNTSTVHSKEMIISLRSLGGMQHQFAKSFDEHVERVAKVLAYQSRSVGLELELSE